MLLGRLGRGRMSAGADDAIEGLEETSMAKIDTDELRDYLEDYCGTAAFSGFPAALLDVADIEDMDGYELCEKSEDLGIDLERFRVDD